MIVNSLHHDARDILILIQLFFNRVNLLIYTGDDEKHFLLFVYIFNYYEWNEKRHNKSLILCIFSLQVSLHRTLYVQE